MLQFNSSNCHCLNIFYNWQMAEICLKRFIYYEFMKNRQQIVKCNSTNVKNRKTDNHQSSTIVVLGKRKQFYLSQLSTHFQSVQQEYLRRSQEKYDNQKDKSKSRQRVKSKRQIKRKSKQKVVKRNRKPQSSKNNDSNKKQKKLIKCKKNHQASVKQNNTKNQELRLLQGNMQQQNKRIHDQSKKTVKMQRNRFSNLFINCENLEIDQKVLQESNVRFNFKKKVQAAIKIQKLVRGYLARKKYKCTKYEKYERQLYNDSDFCIKQRQVCENLHINNQWQQSNNLMSKRFNFDLLYNKGKEREQFKILSGRSSDSSQIVITTKRKEFSKINQALQSQMRSFHGGFEQNRLKEIELVPKQMQKIQQSNSMAPSMSQYQVNKKHIFPPLPKKSQFSVNMSNNSMDQSVRKQNNQIQLKRWKQMMVFIERQMKINNSKDELKTSLSQVLSAVKKNYEQTYQQYQHSLRKDCINMMEDQYSMQNEAQQEYSSFKKKKLSIQVKQQKDLCFPTKFLQQRDLRRQEYFQQQQPKISQLKLVQTKSDQKMNKLPYIFMNQIQDYENQSSSQINQNALQIGSQEFQEYCEQIQQVNQSLSSEWGPQQIKKQIKQKSGLQQLSMINFSKINETIHLNDTVEKLFETSELIYHQKQKNQARKVFEKMKKKQLSFTDQQQFNRHCCDTMIFFSQKMTKEKQFIRKLKEDIKKGLSAQHNLELQIRKQAKNLGFNLFASKSCRTSNKKDMLYLSSILVDEIQIQNFKQLSQLQGFQDNNTPRSFTNQFLHQTSKQSPVFDIPHLKISGIKQHRNEQIPKKRFDHQANGSLSSPQSLFDSLQAQQMEKRFSKKKKKGLSPMKIQNFQSSFSQRIERQLKKVDLCISQKLSQQDSLERKIEQIDQKIDCKKLCLQQIVNEYLVNEVSAQIMQYRHMCQKLITKRPRAAISKIQNEERIVFIGVVQSFLGNKEQLLQKMNQKIVPSPLDLLRCMRVIYDDQESSSSIQSEFEQVGKFEPILNAEICMKAIVQFKSVLAQRQEENQKDSISLIDLLKQQGINQKYFLAIQSRQEKNNQVNKNRKKLRGQIINIEMHCIFDAWNQQIFKLVMPFIGFSGIGLNQVTSSLKDHNRSLNQLSQVREILITSKHKLVDIILDERDHSDKMLQQNFDLLCLDSQWISFAEESLSFFVELVFLIQDYLFQEVALQISGN